jgi:hypothetical protein
MILIMFGAMTVYGTGAITGRVVNGSTAAPIRRR